MDCRQYINRLPARRMGDKKRGQGIGLIIIINNLNLSANKTIKIYWSPYARNIPLGKPQIGQHCPSMPCPF